jgi:hypothetical protein
MPHKSGLKERQLRYAVKIADIKDSVDSFAAAHPNLIAAEMTKSLQHFSYRYLARWNPCTRRYMIYFIILRRVSSPRMILSKQARKGR